jgi:hypothetical protein
MSCDLYPIDSHADRSEVLAARVARAILQKENQMPIIKKAPAILTREVHMEEPVSALLDDYAQFIESSPDHVVNSVLKSTLWRDQDYRKWREGRKTRADGGSRPQSERPERS